MTLLKSTFVLLFLSRIFISIISYGNVYIFCLSSRSYLLSETVYMDLCRMQKLELLTASSMN